MRRSTRALAVASAVALIAGAAGAGEPPADLRSLLAGNPYAYIPPQCYTRTADARGAVFNPCYTCHTASAEPNFADDTELQTAYDFPAPAAVNPWTNLFVDRRAAMAATSDEAMLAYVRTDNYRAGEDLALTRALDPPPRGWDIDGDGTWSGYRPDIWFDFDAEGYDRTPERTRTGWRAFAYAPLPGAFWPANGSADDVAIRLPAAFRQTADSATDWSLYGVNLAIVEALVKRADVPIPPVDERGLGVDLDRDGALATAVRVVFAFDPRNGVTMSYVGRAGGADGPHLAAGLFPEGTEFVHSVRYLDIGFDGSVRPARRMKELRYARKTGWLTYWELRERALKDLREAHDYPDRAERFFGDVESGIATGQGWRFQGFIEDAAGALRPQSFEESLTCAGCHSGVGRTVDDVFSFARKIDAPAAAGGWYPWNAEHPMGALSDPVRPDGTGEYAAYLLRAGGGDEFRANPEIIARYLDALDAPEARAALADEIGPLILPSPARALDLDKAYLEIVRAQSYDRGRLPTIAPLDATVHRAVVPGSPTGIERPAD